MRTEYSIKNSISAFVCNGLSFLIAFIAQAIFIRMLGAEYLGLNGLFSNILSILSFFELGIGNAIVYNLYKPIAENDEKTISALLNFYRKAYCIITIVIFIIGIFILPFIPFFIGDLTININVYVVYLLFLLSTVVSYLMIYKRNLIVANQRNYVINIYHAIYLILLNLVQLLFLYFTRNYYLYLIIKIFFQLIENYLISSYATKKFNYLIKYKNEKINKTTEKNIFKKVKALIFHKIGSVVVLSSDNILISKFFGLLTVGLYNNYHIIINGITVIFGQIISTLTASVGNLLVSNDCKKNYEIFKRIRFLNSWISIFTSISLLVIVQPFIVIWVGEKYLLDFFVVIVIVFNFFQKMQRQTYSTFKDSAGIWIEDRFVPLIESFINIFASIICLKIFGLAGIFIGTIISGLVLWCYSFPKFVYKKILNRSYFDYFKETCGYIVLFLFLATLTYFVSSLFIFDNIFVKLFVNILLSILIPNLLLILFFRESNEFKYFFNLLFGILKKIFYSSK